VFKTLNAGTSNLATDQVYFPRPENEGIKVAVTMQTHCSCIPPVKLYCINLGVKQAIVISNISSHEIPQHILLVHKNVNPRKFKIMATADIFFTLTIYVYIVSCIDNYYSLIISDEDFRIIKYYFHFTRM